MRAASLAACALLTVALGAGTPGQAPVRPRPDPSQRFSTLAAITPSNVSRLEVAWTAHTGEFAGGRGPNAGRPVPGFQTRPVLAGGRLIVTTTTSRVIALDPETGAELWRFDPFAKRPRTCEAPHRGVAVWPAAGVPPDAAFTIISGTCDGRLVALDARTGQPLPTFGDGGEVDLRPGADARDGEEYSVTTPPAIYRDLAIVGTALPEGTPHGPSGDVRAFDVRTGREVWRFHTVPRDGEPGADTWSDGARQRRTGVNAWGGVTVDRERGLVFAPLG